MASSKALLLLFALFALLLVITSEVSALDEQTKDAKESNGVEDAKYGGPGYGSPGYGGPGGGSGRGDYPPRGCRYGCCRGYRYGSGCRRCCAHAHETPDAEFEDDNKN